MDDMTKLQEKMRLLLSLTREVVELKEQTDFLSESLYEDFWNDLDAVEGVLTYLKSNCLI